MQKKASKSRLPVACSMYLWKGHLSVCCFTFGETRPTKKAKLPCLCVLTINGERAGTSIKRFIEPLAWNSAKGKANEKSRGGKDLNLYLDAISANILRIQRDLELDKKRGVCPDHTEPLSGQGAVGPSHADGGLPRPQRKVQGAVGHQPRSGNGDPLRNHATADRGVPAHDLQKGGLLSG